MSILVLAGLFLSRGDDTGKPLVSGCTSTGRNSSLESTNSRPKGHRDIQCTALLVDVDYMYTPGLRISSAYDAWIYPTWLIEYKHPIYNKSKWCGKILLLINPSSHCNTWQLEDTFSPGPFHQFWLLFRKRNTLVLAKGMRILRFIKSLKSELTTQTFTMFT